MFTSRDNEPGNFHQAIARSLLDLIRLTQGHRPMVEILSYYKEVVDHYRIIFESDSKEASAFLQVLYNYYQLLIREEKWEPLEIVGKEMAQLLHNFPEPLNEEQRILQISVHQLLGDGYFFAEDYKKAEKEYRWALTCQELFTKDFPERDFGISVLKLALAEILVKDKSFEEASQLLEKASEISNRWIEIQNSGFIKKIHSTIYLRLGQCLEALEDYDAAEKAFLESIDCLKQSLEKDTEMLLPIYLEACNRLVDFYDLTGKAEKSDPYLEIIFSYGPGARIIYREATSDRAENFLKSEIELLSKKQIELFSRVINSRQPHQLEGDISILKELLAITKEQKTPNHYLTFKITLGDKYLELKKPETIEKALEIYEKALPGVSEQKAPFVWQNLGLAYRWRSEGEPDENIEKSIAFSKKALEGFQRIKGRKVQEAQVCRNLGVAFRHRRKHDPKENLENSVAYYRTALSIYSKINNNDLWARSMLGLLKSYIQLNRFDGLKSLREVKELIGEAEKLTTETAPRELWSELYRETALFFRDSQVGNTQENIRLALKYADKAVKTCPVEIAPNAWVTSYRTLGTILIHLESESGKGPNIDKAIAIFKELSDYERAHPGHGMLTKTLGELGQAYRDRVSGDPKDNLEKAIECFEEAISAYQPKVQKEEKSRVADTFMAFCLIGLGTAYLNRIKGGKIENIEKAIEEFQKAEKWIDPEINPEQWIHLHHEMGLAYSKRERGNPEENLKMGIDAFEQAAGYAKKMGRWKSWALKLQGLSNLYIRRKNYSAQENQEKARSVLKQVLEVFRPDSDRELWFIAMNSLAATYLSEFNEDEGFIKGDIEKARGLYEELVKDKHISLVRPALKGRVFYMLGEIYFNRKEGAPEENFELGKRYFEKALSIFSPGRYPEECLKMGKNIGLRYFRLKQWPEAADALQKVVKAYEVLFTQSLFPSSKHVYLGKIHGFHTLLAYSQAKVDRAKEAFWSIERGKAQNLNEILQREGKDLTTLQKKAPDLVARYQQLLAEKRSADNQERILGNATVNEESLLALRKKIELVDNEFQEISNTLAEMLGKVSDSKTQDLEQVNHYLERRQAIVCPLTTDNGTIVFIVSKSNQSQQANLEVIHLDQFSSREFEKLTSPLEELINNRLNLQEVGDWEAYLETIGALLWDNLIGKIAVSLEEKGVEKCIFLPVQAYTHFPLHLAYTVANHTKTYFLDRFTASYIPSIRVWMHCQDIVNRQEGQLALLGVEYPGSKDSENFLIGASLEVNIIEKWFEPHKILRDESCTQQAILQALPSATVCHFSCHGTNSWLNPLQSSLFIANGQRLMLSHILDLPRTHSRLATLSACETGVAGTEFANEVVGFPTGLIQSGFAGVVASLWPVPDISTTLLMCRFYFLWRMEGIPVDEALQQAQRWMKDTVNREKTEFLDVIGKFISDENLQKQLESIRNHLIKKEWANTFKGAKNWGAFYLMGV